MQFVFKIRNIVGILEKMDDENILEIQNRVREISCLIYVLKMALINHDSESFDTLPYACYAEMLENKANALLSAVDI